MAQYNEASWILILLFLLQLYHGFYADCASAQAAIRVRNTVGMDTEEAARPVELSTASGCYDGWNNCGNTEYGSRYGSGYDSGGYGRGHGNDRYGNRGSVVPGEGDDRDGGMGTTRSGRAGGYGSGSGYKGSSSSRPGYGNGGNYGGNDP